MRMPPAGQMWIKSYLSASGFLSFALWHHFAPSSAQKRENMFRNLNLLSGMQLPLPPIYLEWTCKATDDKTGSGTGSLIYRHCHHLHMRNKRNRFVLFLCVIRLHSTNRWQPEWHFVQLCQQGNKILPIKTNVNLMVEKLGILFNFTEQVPLQHAEKHLYWTDSSCIAGLWSHSVS